MKKIIIISICLITLQLSAQENKNVKDSRKFQQKLNKEFANKEESPLTEEDFKTFKSLDFFPIDT
ncbi:MAG: hypothetical protein KAH72_08350, partial [Flavobacteriaceae bacterium]|nr:hypothetical protein [Flavobacteriaceae bacterium]